MAVHPTAVATSHLPELETLAFRLAEAAAQPAPPEPVLAGFVARHWGKAAARLSQLPSGLEPNEAAGLASALAAALRETTGPITRATFQPKNIRLQPDPGGWQVILTPPGPEAGATLTDKASLAAFTGLLYRLAAGQEFASDSSNRKTQLAQLRNHNPYLATVLEEALTGSFSSVGALAGGFGWSLYRKTYLNYPALLVTKKRSFLQQRTRRKPARPAEQLPAETAEKAAVNRTWGGPLALVSLLVAMVLLAGTTAFSVSGLDSDYQQQSQVTPLTHTPVPTIAPTPSPAVASQVSRQPDGSSLTRYNPALDKVTAQQYPDPSKLTAGQVAALNDFNSLQIQSVHWSQDGKKVDLALKDGGWETWDIVTKQRLARKELPNTEQYQAVSWSPDGQNFVAVGLDGQMRLGKAGRVLRTAALDQTNSPFGRFSTYPWPFSWSPDSAYLLLAVPNNSLQLWSFQNVPTQIAAPQNSRGTYMNLRGNNLAGTVAWSGDSRYLARLVVSSQSQQIEVYNPRNLARLLVIGISDPASDPNTPSTGQNGRPDTVAASGLAWSPDGRYIAIIRTFNQTTSGTTTNYNSSAGGDVVSLLEVPNLTNLGQRNQTGQPIPNAQGSRGSQSIPNAQGTPTAQAIPGAVGVIPVSPVHQENLNLTGLEDGNTAGGRNLVWSKSNRLLVMGTNSSTNGSAQTLTYRALTLDLNSEGGRWHWQIGRLFDLPFQNAHNYVDWTPDSRQILYNTTDNLLGLGLLPEQDENQINSEILHKATSSYNLNYLPSPDGRIFLQIQLKGNTPALVIRDSASGQVQAQLAVPDAAYVYPGKALWSPDSRVLVIPFTIQFGAAGGTPLVMQIIRAWRFEPDKAPALLGDLLAASPDNSYFNSNNNLTWDGKDDTLAVLFETGHNQVGRWELSKLLPSIAEQQQVIAKNANQTASSVNDWPYFQITGQVLGKVSSGGNGTWAWLPDHKHIIYCSSNCYIQELLAPGATYSTEQARGIPFNPAPLGGSNSPAGNSEINLVVSPDGRMAAVALPGGLVNLYDAATGKLFNSFTAHQGPISNLSFSADGHYLVTGGTDRAVKVWDTTTWRLQSVLRLVTTDSITGQVQWLPDNKTLLVSSNYGGSTLFWRALP